MDRKRRYFLCLGGAALLVILLAGAGLCLGEMPLRQALESDILWRLRLPRIATALLAGAALALGGAQMQALFRNPLADPHIMGVSGGAGLGAALAATVTAGAALPIAGAAFLGALAASALILFTATRVHSGTPLLIFGVMLGFILSALTSVVAYTAGEESLKVFYTWSAGTFSSARPQDLVWIGSALTLSMALSLADARGLDLALFGDDFSLLSGGHPARTRVLALTGCCLATAAVTAFCGPLGFAGIASPHIARALSGQAAHRQILPLSLLVGGAIALAADLVAQHAPTPLPAGSTLALIGIPVILWILLRKPWME